MDYGEGPERLPPPKLQYSETPERLPPSQMEYSDPPQRLPPKMPLIGKIKSLYGSLLVERGHLT